MELLWGLGIKFQVPVFRKSQVTSQMISYEVSIGFIIIGVIISAGSLNLSEIVMAQKSDYGMLKLVLLPHLPMVFFFLCQL